MHVVSFLVRTGPSHVRVHLCLLCCYLSRAFRSRAESDAGAALDLPDKAGRCDACSRATPGPSARVLLLDLTKYRRQPWQVSATDEVRLFMVSSSNVVLELQPAHTAPALSPQGGPLECCNGAV
jgi:hypothetical protein